MTKIQFTVSEINWRIYRQVFLVGMKNIELGHYLLSVTITQLFLNLLIQYIFVFLPLSFSGLFILASHVGYMLKAFLWKVAY